MPLNEPAPNFALLSSFDIRDLSGVNAFVRGGSYTVTLPTLSSDDVYEDVLFFVNGRESDPLVRGSGQLMRDATFGGASSWSVSINSDDKIEIKADSQFTVTSTGTNDSLGFGSSTVNSSLVGSDYVATASLDWSRGRLVLADMTYRLDQVGGGSNTFNFPQTTPDIQDITVFLRSSESDADDFGLSSLQELDNTARSVDDITWLVNDAGFVQCHYQTSYGDIVWSSTQLRDLLGFTGNESPVVNGSISRLTATYQSSALLLPTRPIQSHHLQVENVAQSRRKIGGGYASNFIGSYVTSTLSFDLDAALDTRDDYRHFTDRFAPLVSKGERINFYQCWGDSRRALRTDQARGTQSAFDDLFTSEDNGERGRVRGSLKTESFDLAYPTRLHRRVPVSMEIEHL